MAKYFENKEAAKKARSKASKRGLGKFTKTVKDGFSDVFKNLQKDPKANLMSWAKQNPTEFYKLASKLIPTEIDLAGQVRHIIVTRKKVNGE